MKRLYLPLLLFLSACQSSPQFPANDSLEMRTQVYAGQSRIPFERMLDRLARADAVFVGEYHDDETTHDIERAIYEGLIERRAGRVVLAMEMFERDVQGVLDRYLAGELTEKQFVREARAWGNYKTGYRAIVELAREKGLPVVASNAPRRLARRVSHGKRATFEGLSAEERTWLATDLRPNTVSYWQRFARAVRGHIDVENVSTDHLLYSVQSLWDNTMGDSCARALDQYPGYSVLHLNGGFHSRDHDGTVRQFSLRRPEAETLTVDVRPVTDLEYLDPGSIEPRGDYTVYAKQRGRGARQGRFAVATAGRLEFRLHVPSTASEDNPAPLLIWLVDDGALTTDVLAYWEGVFGDRAAVCVVEPPQRQRQVRLYVAGQWFWPDTLFEDVGPITQGLARLQAYVQAHFAVADRTVLVGEGSGATVAISSALDTADLLQAAHAIQPRRFAKFRESSLPDPEDAPETPILTVYGTGSTHDWWQQERQAYESVGHGFEVTEPVSEGVLEERLRADLGLPAAQRHARAPVAFLCPAGTSEPAATWARGLARAVAGDARRAELVTLGALPSLIEEHGSGVLDGARVFAFAHEEVPDGWKAFQPQDLTAGYGIPLAPGSFGGTTVLVLPEGMSGAELDAWMALEEADVLKKRSRFHHLRVAPGPAALSRVLGELVSSGRSNVLVVPAEFCATATTMRVLEAHTVGHQDALQLHWLPGVGGALRRLFEDRD